ncbi:MAG: hypothetical protein SPI77_03820 [Corynebacterium sp.]|nr:hypothetical protein [Corynebacterium sp.]
MTPLVGVIMGSDSDWPTVEPAAQVLGLKCIIACAAGAKKAGLLAVRILGAERYHPSMGAL